MSIPLFDVYLAVGVCLPLQGSSSNVSCLDTTIVFDEGAVATTLSISGQVTTGDIRPLAWFLPAEFSDTFVIDGNPSHPLTLSVTATFSPVASLAFSATGTLQLDLSGLGLGRVMIGVGCEGVILDSGVQGAFIAQMLPFTLPGRFGSVNMSYVALATADGVPALTILGRQVVSAKGFLLLTTYYLLLNTYYLLLTTDY